MIPALPCGTFADSETPAGAFYVAVFEDGDIPHHVGEYRIDVVIRALILNTDTDLLDLDLATVI